MRKVKLEACLGLLKRCLKVRWKEFELYLKFGGKAIESLRDYKVVAEKVKVLAEEILGDVQVYVFGSVVEGRVTASSDIDVLVIVKETDDKKSTGLNL